MGKLIDKLTFWKAVFFASSVMAIVTVFTSKSLDLLTYNCLLMALALGFDRIEKLIKDKNNV